MYMIDQSQLEIGEFYHVYNRGTEKRDLFLDRSDYQRFLLLLYLCNSLKSVHLQVRGQTLNKIFQTDRGDTLVDITCYCLMPNHFHLLIHVVDKAALGKFMQKLCTGYTMYFNRKYERSGTLFQGKYKSAYVDTDAYLKYLFSYIHLNPVKLIQPDWKEVGINNVTEIENFLDTYEFSSYIDFKHNNRVESGLLNNSAAPLYFSTIQDLETEVRSWLMFEV